MPQKPEERSQSNFTENNRIIYCSGHINEEKAEQVILSLLKFESISATKDVLMYIDSYGGVVDSFIAMHDAMKMVRCPVATICIGKAMSCGQMLLISGTKGKRFITPNARVMIHQISSITGGKLNEMETDLQESARLQKLIENLICKYTKLKHNELKTIMNKDTYLTAEQSMKMGIVDHIITSPGSLYDKLKI